MPLPSSRYLTSDVPGSPGVIRSDPSDFRVEERLPFRPRGFGPFALILVEKRGISTPEAIRRLSHMFQVPQKQIGYAGLKDSEAVALQHFTLPGVRSEDADGREFTDGRVLQTWSHDAPLFLGALQGNHFDIRVREIGKGFAERARAILAELERRGVPHLYGEQRFGVRGEGPALGRALLSNDAEAFLSHLLGRPSDLERDPRVRQARDLYDRGDTAAAWKAFPAHRRLERRALEGFLRGLTPAEVLYTIPATDKRFFLTSYQSMVFNRALLRRLPGLDVVWEGDLVREEGTERVRLAAGLPRDQAAAEGFRLSPTGMLPGYAVALALGRQGILEREVFEEEGLRPGDFRKPAGLPCRGERRPLRIRISEVTVREEEGAVCLSFFLPRGAFATSVLREIFKPGQEPEAVLGRIPDLFL